ncbi:MAG TPA: hypothetical protein PKK06_05660 [Phycisphaerae bacterium]|nr:hypothetical protein [Phycisphaerae bacterium]HNU44755.1 hypothetical protein [Phycisphaerae bacterium]
MSSCKTQVGPDIVRLAFMLADAVACLVARVRAFCYEVMLAGHACPGCGGNLVMVRDGACRCLACGRTFDPTVVFQTCAACGGRPRVRIRRYECNCCHAEIMSRFLFDGLVFDAAYFREKMAEHRERKHDQRERVRLMLAACRSPAVEVDPAGLDGLAALQAALDELTRSVEPAAAPPSRSDFDLHRYERHVQAQCTGSAIALADIPPLIEDPRRDLIYRFIAIIFLAHAGVLTVWQEGSTIWVTNHDADRERQAVSGAVEAADGVA